jgi:hypothetical protein
MNERFARRTVAALPTVGLAALAAAMAGCSGGGSNASPGNCGAPTGQVALSYPAPGATGIPDNIPGIVFASTNGLSSSYGAVVAQAGSSSSFTFLAVAPAPSPLPSPNVMPFPNAVYQESASGGTILAAGTSYGVYLNDFNSNCTPTLLGTFTTQ